jgi:hypothetical protein
MPDFCTYRQEGVPSHFFSYSISLNICSELVKNVRRTLRNYAKEPIGLLGKILRRICL